MNIGDLVAHLRIDRSRVRPALQDTEDDADRAGRRSGARFAGAFGFGVAALAQAAQPGVDKLGEKLAGLGKVANIAALAGGFATLPGAIAPAAAALAALPAVATMGIGAMAAYKVATAGVGDALKALASGDAAKASEALAKLAPEARETVLAFNKIRESFKATQQRIQGMFFEGLADQVRDLGKIYLPILDKGLYNVAGGLSQMASTALGVAATPFFSGKVASILSQTGDIMEMLAPVGGDLMNILIAVADAGMGMVRALASWAADGTAAAAAFLTSAEGAQWLTDKINAAQVVLGKLGAIVAGLGAGIIGVFTAASASGFSMLDVLVQLSQGFATWAQSVEGQKQLTAVFTLLTQTLQAMGPMLGLVSGAVLMVIQAITSLPAPLQGVITSFLAWSLVIGMALPKVLALVKVVSGVGALLSAGSSAIVMTAARWGLLGTAGSTAAAATNASALSVIGAWLRMAAAATLNGIRAGAAWLLATGASMAGAVARTVATVASMLVQWTILAARATASAALTAGAWLLTTGAAAATALASMAVTVAAYLVSWAVAAAGAMASAIAMAAAWFVALGPVGWVIAIVVGLVALIIANWDTVVSWTTTAWNAVVAAVTAAWDWIVGLARRAAVWVLQAVAKLLELQARFRAYFQAAYQAVVERVNAIVAWVRALPGRILQALANLGSLLVGLGRDLVNGLWRGIQAGWAWLTGAVRNLAGQLLNAAKSALGIASPSKLFRKEVGRWIPAGVALGIDANASDAIRATERLGDAALGGAMSAFRATGSVTGPERNGEPMSPADVLAAAAEAFGRVLDGAKLRVTGRDWASLVRAADTDDRRRGGGLIAPAR